VGPPSIRKRYESLSAQLYLFPSSETFSSAASGLLKRESLYLNIIPLRLCSTSAFWVQIRRGNYINSVWISVYCEQITWKLFWWCCEARFLQAQNYSAHSAIRIYFVTGRELYSLYLTEQYGIKTYGGMETGRSLCAGFLCRINWYKFCDFQRCLVPPSSGRSVYFYHITRWNNVHDGSFHNDRRENLRSHCHE
jgi:hypothetical protein